MARAKPAGLEEEPVAPAPTSSFAQPVRVEIEEVPIFVIDEVIEESKFELPVASLLVPVPAGTAEKIVPVCSIQEDVMLSESMDLEVTDFFVALPCMSKSKASKAEKDEEADSKVDVYYEDLKSPGDTTDRSLTRAVTWPGQDEAQIPTANTFVHFPVERALPRRRALSV